MPAAGCGMRSGRSSSAATTARPGKGRLASAQASGVPPATPSSVATVAAIQVRASASRSSPSVSSLRRPLAPAIATSWTTGTARKRMKSPAAASAPTLAAR